MVLRTVVRLLERLLQFMEFHLTGGLNPDTGGFANQITKTLTFLAGYDKNDGDDAQAQVNVDQPENPSQEIITTLGINAIELHHLDFQGTFPQSLALGKDLRNYGIKRGKGDDQKVKEDRLCLTGDQSRNEHTQQRPCPYDEKINEEGKYSICHIRQFISYSDILCGINFDVLHAALNLSPR